MSAREVFVVTGASSGIGHAVAAAYASRGASIVVNARDEAKLVRAAEALGAEARVAVVAGDIGEPETADRLVEAAYTRFGRLDGVVNNAGIFVARPFTDYVREELDALVQTNLAGTVQLSQAAVRAWREKGAPGSIVSISAAIGISPQATLPAALPVAVKAGINALTRALALELAPERIRVNAVAPGLIRTPLIPNPDALGAAQPLGHIGEPEDVANAVVYLGAAPFVTGVVLPVDGGMSVGHW